MTKRYRNFHDYFYSLWGTKVIKLSLDGGFSCPNRDGTVGHDGCLFCSESGSGDFLNGNDSLPQQIEQQKTTLHNKWKDGKYIAYFQNYTGTYGELSDLKEKYEQVLNHRDISGIAIATRADCLNEETLNYLEELSKHTFLWIELGMQTIHNSTLSLIQRGYLHSVFHHGVTECKRRNIRIVPQIILGLPKETRSMREETIRYISSIHPWGLKIHSLYIQKNSPLYPYYLKHPFQLMSKEEYVEEVCDYLEILPREIILHRLTGDPNKKCLYAPIWTKNKLSVLSSIDFECKKRNIPLYLEAIKI